MGRKPCRIVQGWGQVPRALINLSVVVHMCYHNVPVRVALISHTVRRNSCSLWTSWPWTYSRKMTRVPVPSLWHKEDHQLFSGPHIWCGTCAHTICSYLSAAIMTFNIFSLCMRHILRKEGGSYKSRSDVWLVCLHFHPCARFAFPLLTHFHMAAEALRSVEAFTILVLHI